MLLRLALHVQAVKLIGFSVLRQHVAPESQLCLGGERTDGLKVSMSFSKLQLKFYIAS